MSEPERVLFVHAHPDDESISTGGTIATLIDRGAIVTVLTCTRGERGEVIPPDLAHLATSLEALGSHRELELQEALQALGVRDHRFLGDSTARWPGRAPRRYLDSGMAWGPEGAVPLPEQDPASLATAEFGEVAADIAAVIVQVQPDVVVSYDERGGYGHPDHVRAHEAARRAADVYDKPYFAVRAADSQTTSRSGASFDTGSAVDIDVRPVLDRKRAALAAHRSQLSVEGDTFVLSNGTRHDIGGVESFRRIRQRRSAAVTPFDEQHWAIKTGAAAVGAMIGLAVGVLLTVVHQSTITLAGVAVPIGLVASLVLVSALLAGLRLVFATRLVAGFAALGVLVSVGVLSLESSGGSILVPDNELGRVWAIAPAVVAFVVLAWPKLPQRRRDRIGASSK